MYGEIYVDLYLGNLWVMFDGWLVIFDLGMVVYMLLCLCEWLLKILFVVVDGRGEEVVDDLISISMWLEVFDEECYLCEIG